MRPSSSTAKPPVPPILRWAGSKRLLLRDLLDWVPEKVDQYVEPFAGSAALASVVQFQRALLGDTNPALINFYNQLKREPRELHALASSFPVSEEMYYRIRSQFVPWEMGIESAAKFFYLNRYCFNGVYRTSRSGLFNVPMGKNTGGMPVLEQLVSYAKAIRKAKFHCGDFSETIQKAEKGSVLYVDPPYNTFGVRRRGEYGPKAFSEKDISRLTELMISQRDKKIIFSYNYDRTMSTTLSQKGWEIRRISVRRHVSGFSKDRRIKHEMIARNFYG